MTSKSLSLGLGIILLAAYVGAGALSIQAHQNPTEMDTVAYLSAAVDIQETGGIQKHIQNCLKGIYKEATQHPLYLLLLSVAAEQNIRFFVFAKILTFFIGLVFLFVLFTITSKVFNKPIAFGVVFLTIFNATFLRITTMVACESLMALNFMLFWFFSILGFKNKRFWCLAGVFAGLTFLTKSLGILTLPIFLASVLWMNRKALLKVLVNPWFWSFFISFVIIVSPLFLRNMKVYGKPMFSDSSAVLWMDDWSEYSKERVLEGRYGIKQYIQSHSVGDMVHVLIGGLLDRDARMLSDGFKPLPFWKPVDLAVLQGFHQKTVSWQGFWALGILLLFLYSLFRKRETAEGIVTFFSVMAFLVFVAWFSKIFETTPPTRLLYCILFPILIFSVSACYELMKTKSMKKYFAIVGSMVIIVSCFLFWKTQEWSQINILNSYKIGSVIQYQLAWLEKALPSGQKALVGNQLSSIKFYYPDKIKGDIVDWPKKDNLADAMDFIQKENIRIVIIDLATVVYNQQVFGGYFAFGKNIGLRQIKPLPPLFKRIPQSNQVAPLFAIYEV